MRADARICSYCQKPTEGNMVRLDPTDPSSPRVALEHGPCRLLHSEALRPLHVAAMALAEDQQ